MSNEPLEATAAALGKIRTYGWRLTRSGARTGFYPWPFTDRIETILCLAATSLGAGFHVLDTLARLLHELLMLLTHAREIRIGGRTAFHG